MKQTSSGFANLQFERWPGASWLKIRGSQLLRSLPVRIRLAFVLIAVLPMTIVAIFTTQQAVQALREEASRHLQLEVANKAAALGHFIEQVESELRFLSAAAARAAFGEKNELEQLQDDYLHFARTYPFIDQLRLISNSGVERLRIERRNSEVAAIASGGLQDKSDRYYLEEALKLEPGEIYTSPVDFNEEHGAIEKPERLVVRFATPLQGPAGNKDGLLIINLSAELFVDALTRLTQGTGGSAYLMQSNVYLTPGADKLPDQNGALNIKPMTELNSWLPGAVKSRILAGEKGVERAGNMLLAFAPVEGSQQTRSHEFREWRLLVGLEERYLASGLVNIPLLYSAVAVIALMALLIGYLVTRKVFRPLADLGTQTERIANGDLTSRATITSRDEIGALGHRFNFMAEQIESLYQDIESRRKYLDEQVRIRTNELDQERGFLRFVINHVADGVLVLGRSDRIELANPAATLLLQGVVTPARIDCCYLGDLWEEWPEHVKTAEEQSIQLDWFLGDRVLAVHVGAAVDVESISGRVLVCRDVTKEREIQAERRELDRHIFHMEKMNALGEVAAGIAHEVGNPLAGIKAVVQAVLARNDIPARAVLQLTRIGREVDRLSCFVRSFRGFAAPRELEIRLCSLHEIVDDVMLWTRQEARKHGISIQYRKCTVDTPNLMIDPNMLKQALLNLVINSIQAMGDSGGQITISRCFRHSVDGNSGTFAAICVEDTGPGIDPSLHRRIFDAFFTTRHEGSGLGLAVVKKIIEQHDGQIHIRSPESGGTRIEMLWPLSGEPVQEGNEQRCAGRQMS